jgi:hypothetical protein
MLWMLKGSVGIFIAACVLTGGLTACASSGVTEGVNTASAKIDPNSVGLSVQYSLTEQKLKLKPFYSPSAQVATKANLISPIKTITPSSYADPANPLDVPATSDANTVQPTPAPEVEAPATNNTP